jgi:hypothetical protein
VAPRFWVGRFLPISMMQGKGRLVFLVVQCKRQLVVLMDPCKEASIHQRQENADGSLT